jgi:hypothetical protein
MINSTPFTSLAGTTWLEINVGTADNFTIDLIDMGTIDYEFDLIPSDQEIQSIGGMPGATSIVVDDMTSTRESLYDYLVDKLGNYDGFLSREVPKAKVTFYLQEPDNITRYEFPFEFTVADLGIDDRSKKTTIALSPRTVNLTVDEWANEAVASGIPSRMSYESQGTFFINSWPSGDFIYNVVERLDTNANTIYISGDLGATASLPNPIYVFERLTDIVNSPTNIFVDDYSTLMFVQNVQMDFASENSVFSKVRTFAGMEGAIFGSAFNHNFYINRLTNSINIDIGIDDVSELKFKQHSRDINAVIINFTNTNKISDTTNIGDGLPRITNASGGVPAWQTGSRLLSTTFTGFYPQLNRGKYDATDNYVTGDDDSLFAINDILLARFAAGVYARPTGAAVSDTSLYKAEFDILGATKIKPWEVVKFDNSVPLRYQGKHFRPTSLSYDLKADKVKVTAYEIDTFEIEPPTPSASGTFAVSDYKYVLNENEAVNNLLVLQLNGERVNDL